MSSITSSVSDRAPHLRAAARYLPGLLDGVALLVLHAPRAALGAVHMVRSSELSDDLDQLLRSPAVGTGRLLYMYFCSEFLQLRDDPLHVGQYLLASSSFPDQPLLLLRRPLVDPLVATPGVTWWAPPYMSRPFFSGFIKQSLGPGPRGHIIAIPEADPFGVAALLLDLSRQR